MHIFRWLMSHPIITAWILAALAILLNINMGSKSGVEHGNNDVVSHVVESGEGVATETSSQAHGVTDNTGSAEKLTKVEHGHATGSSAMHQSEKAASAHSHNTPSDPAVVKTVTAPSQVLSNAIPVSTNVTEEEHSASTAGTNAVPSKSDNSTLSDAAAEDLTSMSSEDLLKLAREAFWQNKKDRSAAIYQALVKRDPSSLAYKGELANVLWHQNKQKDSAALYAEIAMPLLKEGKSREVANMLGFIGVFFPEKAAEIHRSMSE